MQTLLNFSKQNITINYVCKLHVTSVTDIEVRDVTWSDAVDNSNESVSISPAGPKVIDLDSELTRHLSLNPLEQRLLGSQLPLLLRLPVDGSLSDGPVIVCAAGVAASVNTWACEPLTQLLQDSCVLFNLK